MSATGLCLQCNDVAIPGIWEPAPATHCYGTGDRIMPGLLGGFVCSCECRHWVKPDEPRFGGHQHLATVAVTADGWPVDKVGQVPPWIREVREGWNCGEEHTTLRVVPPA